MHQAKRQPFYKLLLMKDSERPPVVIIMINKMTPCWGLNSHCLIIGDDQSTQWRRVCIHNIRIPGIECGMTMSPKNATLDPGTCGAPCRILWSSDSVEPPYFSRGARGRLGDPTAADDDSTPMSFFLLGWLFKAACMAMGSLALAIAATLKTPMVETGVDTGKSRGFVDLQGGFTMDLLGKFSSREMIR